MEKEQYAHYVVSYEKALSSYRDSFKAWLKTDEVIWVSEFFMAHEYKKARDRFEELMKSHNVRFMGATMIAHHQPIES